VSDRAERQGAAPLLYAGLASGMIVFGSATPVSKIVTSDMPVFIGAGLRVLLGALVLAPFVHNGLSQVRSFDRRDLLLVAAIAVFGMFGFTAFLLLGMRMISGVYGSVVMATTPAVTAAVAILLLGENATWRKIAALFLAVAGVAVLQLTGSGGGGEEAQRAFEARDPLTRWIMGLPTSTLLGIALVFAAVCCEATYTLAGRAMSREVDPVLVAFLAAAASLPLFVPFAIVQWPSFDPAAVSIGGWIALAWYGAGTLSLGTWLWYMSISQTEGSIAAAFMGLMPVSALVLSYILLGEPFRWMHMLGFGITFLGVLLMSWEHARGSD
jgi:drug/metabolite transporter (DMT)-like permease